LLTEGRGQFVKVIPALVLPRAVLRSKPQSKRGIVSLWHGARPTPRQNGASC